MTTIEAVLRPVAQLINKNIRETTPARELCRSLSGTTVAVRVRDSAIAANFVIGDEAMDIVPVTIGEPDIVIDGSLLTLVRMAGDSGAAAIRDGSLDLTGDAELADQFRQLLAFAKPDVEEELAGIVGDVAAHRLGEMARGAARWGRDARATMGANIREYLQEEGRDAPSRYEVEQFSAAVDTLRDDVDRIEARINQLPGDH